MVHREYLNQEEVNKLQEIYENKTLKPNYQNVLQYFLFSCYTGLRYQDVKDLRYKNIRGDALRFQMHKTKDDMENPLSRFAKSVLPPNRGLNYQKVFRVYENQPTNRMLKDIMDEFGIEKDISFHCARQTFATLSINHGVDIFALKSLLGHRKMETTMIYAKAEFGYKKREMDKWETENI